MARQDSKRSCWTSPNIGQESPDNGPNTRVLHRTRPPRANAKDSPRKPDGLTKSLARRLPEETRLTNQELAGDPSPRARTWLAEAEQAKASRRQELDHAGEGRLASP